MLVGGWGCMAGALGMVHWVGRFTVRGFSSIVNMKISQGNSLDIIIVKNK